MIAVGIDIGTNTALMVVASITHEARVEILHDVHELPRLGEGLVEEFVQLIEELMRRTCCTVSCEIPR